MKYALIIPDGCADEPQPCLSQKTPLQAARVPHMDHVAQLGETGMSLNVPDALPSGSDVGTMSLFGYSPLKFHTGRAPIEAAAQGIELGPEDWAVRCNFVTVADERMQSFTAGQIPNDLGAELVRELQHAYCGNENIKFYRGVSYRNLMLWRARDRKAPFSADTFTVPPHDITEQTIADHLPLGSGACDLRAVMEKSRGLFAANAANQARGELAATQCWLWGQGQAPALQNFKERYGVQGAVITAVDLLRGLGRLLGWDIIDVPGATGYLDTDYAAKGRYAIETLKSGTDFIVVHVEATDEASHEGHADEKVKALESIDHHIVGPVHEYLQSQGDYRILISPDHPTFLRTKTHSHGFTPFTMAGAGVATNGSQTYDEIAADQTGLRLPEGWDLMGRFLGSER